MGFDKPHQLANFEGRCRNIKEEPPILKSSLAQGHAHFSSGCDFMMGFGKPKLHTKFEFASFSRCKNIKGGPQNVEELPYPRTTPTFSVGVIL